MDKAIEAQFSAMAARLRHMEINPQTLGPRQQRFLRASIQSQWKALEQATGETVSIKDMKKPLASCSLIRYNAPLLRRNRVQRWKIWLNWWNRRHMTGGWRNPLPIRTCEVCNASRNLRIDLTRPCAGFFLCVYCTHGQFM